LALGYPQDKAITLPATPVNGWGGQVPEIPSCRLVPLAAGGGRLALSRGMGRKVAPFRRALDAAFAFLLTTKYAKGAKIEETVAAAAPEATSSVRQACRALIRSLPPPRILSRLSRLSRLS